MCDERTFDELVELNQTDPEAFEEYRKAFINKALTDMCADCPECLKRCEKFQWRLEQELNKFKNPISRYNRMVEMFWEQTKDFQQALAGNPPKPKQTENPKIIQFPKK
jgi:hypothetical protein